MIGNVVERLYTSSRTNSKQLTDYIDQQTLIQISKVIVDTIPQNEYPITSMLEESFDLTDYFYNFPTINGIVILHQNRIPTDFISLLYFLYASRSVNGVVFSISNTRSSINGRDRYLYILFNNNLIVSDSIRTIESEFEISLGINKLSQYKQIASQITKVMQTFTAVLKTCFTFFYIDLITQLTDKKFDSEVVGSLTPFLPQNVTLTFRVTDIVAVLIIGLKDWFNQNVDIVHQINTDDLIYLVRIVPVKITPDKVKIDNGYILVENISVEYCIYTKRFWSEKVIPQIDLVIIQNSKRWKTDSDSTLNDILFEVLKMNGVV